MPIGAEQSLMRGRGGRAPSSRFRSTFTTPEGLGKTDIFMGHVTNVDLVNHTVDVVSQFDQMRLLDVPVGSPYQHSNRGEGLTVLPEVGAKCSVCWPSDSSPPFVFAFVMPHETIPDAGLADDGSNATGSRGSTNQAATAASYAGGRPVGKPGDMYLRGRDGNFVVLHRGGVLQIGSNELSQRIYVPLNNLVVDVAENYMMHNAGGAIRWGIQDGEGESQLPAEFKQTFRVYANEKYADIRIAVGRVHDPIAETDEDGITDQELVAVGKTEPVVYELTLARNGFSAEDNSQAPNVGNLVKLRFVFDRAGNTFTRIDGNVGILCKKRLRLRVKEEAEVFADSSFSLTVASDARIQVGGNFEVTAKVTRFNGGDKPVAHVGSQVSVTLPIGLLMAVPAPPGFAPIPPGLNTAIGVVTSGRSEILV
jgi:hypothetical protein